MATNLRFYFMRKRPEAELKVSDVVFTIYTTTQTHISQLEKAIDLGSFACRINTAHRSSVYLFSRAAQMVMFSYLASLNGFVYT